MPQPILFEIENGIAVITLNRPQRRNAINQALLISLYDALEEVGANDSIRVAILTGAGKSFCSGIDLKALSSDNLFDPRGDGKDFPDIIDACQKPIIGAINGHAITGGLEIALQCDFLIASERATFADTHARVGIHPGWGMTQLLQEAIGIRNAKRMSFSGQFIDADTALRWGLISEVVSHDQLVTRAKEIAKDICDMNQSILLKIKKLIETRRSSSLNEAIQLERQGFEAFANENKLKD